MAKKLFVLIGVFCLGAIGGIWSQAFLLPYFANHPSFQEWGFVQRWNARIQIVNRTEQVVIDKSEAVELAAAKVSKVSVGIESKQGRNILQGSGFVYTTDGLIVTLSELVPVGYEVTVYDSGNVLGVAQVIKRDTQNNLALLKIEKQDLQTAGISNTDSVRLGIPVFFLAMDFTQEGRAQVVNQGIVKSFSREILKTTIEDRALYKGSPLFDIQGNILGIVSVDKQNSVSALSIGPLRIFLGMK